MTNDSAPTPKRARSKMRGQIQSRGDGRWLVRVPRGRDATGKRLYHNATIHGTKRTAQQYLAKVLREMDLGVFVERNQEPVGDYLLRWLSTVAARRVKARTLQDYEAIVRQHLIPLFGNWRLHQLTTERIEEGYAALTSRGLSPRTVRYAHSVLHSALEHAVARGHLQSNPARRATLPKHRARETRSLSVAEATAFLAAAERTRFGVLWHVLLMGGLRPGEALALKWSDIDDHRLRIQRSLVRLKDGSWSFDEPKTAKARRTVPLPSATISILRSHKAQQSSDRLRAGPAWQDHDLVFCTHEGAPLEWRVITRRYFRPLLKECGIRHFRPYDLRHSCATLLLASGENAKVVSERLGHASVTLTLDVYSHVLPDMQERAADRLETLLLKAEGA